MRMKKLRPFVLLGFCGASAAVAALGLSSSAYGSTSVHSVRLNSSLARDTKVVKPDFAFYAGKTVTLIVPAAIGGSFDDFARIVAPLMASYLHCTINIVDNSAGGNIVGQDLAAAAVPNGLTIGEMNPGSDVAASASHIPTVNFAIQDVPIIDGIPSNGGALVAQPNYAIKSFKELVRTKSTTPIVIQAGGTTTFELQVFLRAYNIRTRYITGYTSGAAVVTGFLRGDGPMAIQGYTVFSSLIAAGQARPLVVAAPIAKGVAGYSQMLNVPTFASYSATHPPTRASGKKAIKVALSLVNIPSGILFAPVGTPTSLVAALAAAARSALSQKGAQASELLDGLKPGYYTPIKTETDIRDAVRHESLLSQYLNS